MSARRVLGGSARRFAGRSAAMRRERGAVLVVGIIVLTLITVLVVSAFNLTQSNQKVVYNMQVREDAVAAAQVAVERVVSSNFTSNLSAQTPQSINIDLNNDGASDYSVTVAVPQCIRATPAAASQVSEVEMGGNMQTAGFWFTDWEIRAAVNDTATGARATVVQGIRLYQTETEKNLECP